MPTISSLFVYPIKSCAGISLDQLQFDRRGPVWDRRYVLVDGNGRFITQRTNSTLARIQPRIGPRGLVVSAPGQRDFQLGKPTTKRRRVTVWSFEGDALDMGRPAAKWFSEAIEQECRLMAFAPDVKRATSKQHTDTEAEVGFADGYPVLLVSVESLTELNRRLSVALPMNRFRPNIVVRDCSPFEEDSWSRLEHGELALEVVKPCVRCKVTTIDQHTLATGKEPLATLATFRRTDAGVTFGQNCIHWGTGALRVGDEIRTFPRPQNPASGSTSVPSSAAGS